MYSYIKIRVLNVRVEVSMLPVFMGIEIRRYATGTEDAPDIRPDTGFDLPDIQPDTGY
jgi:hypothetical protein